MIISRSHEVLPLRAYKGSAGQLIGKVMLRALRDKKLKKIAGAFFPLQIAFLFGNLPLLQRACLICNQQILCKPGEKVQGNGSGTTPGSILGLYVTIDKSCTLHTVHIRKNKTRRTRPVLLGLILSLSTIKYFCNALLYASPNFFHE